MTKKNRSGPLHTAGDEKSSRPDPGFLRMMLALLTQRERRQVYWLSVAVLVMAIMEVLGIASIMPFMAVVSDPATLTGDGIPGRAYRALGFGSPEQFLVALGFVVLLTLVISNAFTALTTWLLVRFTWLRNHTLSLRLLQKYLYQPYVFFLNRNTADLSKNILTEVASVVTGILLPGMQVVAKGVVAIFIIGFLMFVDPVLAVAVAVVLGSAYGLLYLMVQKRITVLGVERLRANEGRFRAASEALGGIKELKLTGREDAFLAQYSAPSFKFAVQQAQKEVVANLPRYGLEAIAFGGIVVITLYQLRVQDDMSKVVPVISLYAFAAYRLMPALQQVFAGITSIRFNLPALAVLYRDLGGAPVAAASPSRLEPLPCLRSIELAQASFSYPNASQPAVRELNLTIAARTTVGFVGATGSGKTTTVDLILGLLWPTSGSVLVDGVALDSANVRSWQRSLGYVPQHIYLTDDSIARNIAFGIDPAAVDRSAVERAGRLADLHDFVVNELPQGYDTHVGERGVRLSGGQRQRIGIARALYHDPSVVAMDEATSALDGVTEDAVMRAIANMAHTKTIILVAHRLTTVRNCDVIFLFDGGTPVATGTYDELLRSNARFRAMAGVGSAPKTATDFTGTGV